MCIFCSIVKKEIPASVVYEDDFVIAFHDISKCAPTHIIIIPKEHICSALEVDETNSGLIAKCFEVVPKIAGKEGLLGGFRLINNCGEGGGQTIGHFHIHMLAGFDGLEKLV